MVANSETTPKKSPKAPQSLNAVGGSPYAVALAKAYKKVFDSLPKWRQIEIAELTAAKNYDSPHWKFFIDAVNEESEKIPTS